MEPLQKQYTFHFVDKCNMCHSTQEMHKLLGRRLDRAHGKNPRKKGGIATTVWRCKSCGLVFANPVPVPLDLRQHYGVEPEKYWNDDYFRSEQLFSRQIATYRNLRPEIDHPKALDIGAGLGKCMKELAANGFDVYGIEASKSFYDAAISLNGIAPERLLPQGLEAAKYDPAFFDFITFGAVLEHLENPDVSLQKALQWLKPNGLIHIEVPSSDWLISRLANWFYKMRLMDYVVNISPMHSPFHLFEFTLDSFRKNGESNSYRVEKFEYSVCETYLPKFCDPFFKKIMQMSQTGMQLEVWLTRQNREIQRK